MASIYRTPAARQELEGQYQRFLSHWPVSHRRFHVPTSQGATFVIASGDEDRPPLVLLHGALANSLTWMGDVGTLAQSFRVYAVDVIGEPGLSAPSRPSLRSDAYATWLTEVVGGLGLERFALGGISLGGWLALDYAWRRPETVDRLVLLCPGGVGQFRDGILVKILVLNLFGRWGRRKLRETILGPIPGDASPERGEFWTYFERLQKDVRPRMDRLPVFTDQALARLDMPVLAIVGGRDVFFDSFDTRARIGKLPQGEVILHPDRGHFLVNQADAIHRFLTA